MTLNSLKSVFWLVPAFIASCAPVQTKEKITDEHVRDYQKKSVPKGVLNYEVQCRNDPPGELHCSITASDVCEVVDVEVINRTIHRENSTSTWSKVLEWTSAGLLVVSGCLVTIDAGYLPNGNDPLDSNPVGKEGAYAIGGSLLGVGAGLLTLATVDSIRAVDEVDKIGNIKREVSKKPISCNSQVLANKNVEVLVGNYSKKTKTDENGNLRVKLYGLVPDELVLNSSVEDNATIKIDSKVVKEISISPFFELVKEKEKVRIAKLEEARKKKKEAEQKRKKKIQELLSRVPSVLTKNSQSKCYSFLDKHSVVLSKHEVSPDIRKLKRCAAIYSAKKAKMALINLDLLAGDRNIIWIKKVAPNEIKLPQVKNRIKVGFRTAVKKFLNKEEFQLARELTDKCAEYSISRNICRALERKIDLNEERYFYNSVFIALRNNNVVYARRLAQDCLDYFSDSRLCGKAKRLANKRKTVDELLLMYYFPREGESFCKRTAKARSITKTIGARRIGNKVIVKTKKVLGDEFEVHERHLIFPKQGKLFKIYTRNFMREVECSERPELVLKLPVNRKQVFITNKCSNSLEREKKVVQMHKIVNTPFGVLRNVMSIKTGQKGNESIEFWKRGEGVVATRGRVQGSKWVWLNNRCN